MAGSIILDLGINLFIEGVVETYEKFDRLEYASVWIIVVILNLANMTAGLVAGLLAAISTFMLQHLVDKDPVKLACDAASLPSSKWRTMNQTKILEKGRSRIVIFQLQSHIFFGNIGQIAERIFAYLDEKKRGQDAGVFRVILDFSNVYGIDSTSTAYIEKMIQRISKQYDAATVMVSGPMDLDENAFGSQPPSQQSIRSRRKSSVVFSETTLSRAVSNGSQSASRRATRVANRRVSTAVRGPYEMLDREAAIHGTFFETMDQALIKCEEDLIAQYDLASLVCLPSFNLSESEGEREEVVEVLNEKFVDATEGDISAIVECCKREVFMKGDMLWMVGDVAASAKIVVGGTLTATTDDGDQKNHRHTIECGDIIGLRSMILSERHSATVSCLEECVFYTLDRDAFKRLLEEKPKAAHALDTYMARELARRLRHLSGVSGIGVIDS